MGKCLDENNTERGIISSRRLMIKHPLTTVGDWIRRLHIEGISRKNNKKHLHVVYFPSGRIRAD
jgi:hypothetical protein